MKTQCLAVVIGLFGLLAGCESSSVNLDTDPQMSVPQATTNGVIEEPQECTNDTYEDNDTLETATPVPLSGVKYDFFANFDVPTHTVLCSGDTDWYRIPGSELDWDQPYLFVRARVEGNSYCGGGCGDSLESAPENTMTIDLYDANGVQLSTKTSSNGRVWITTHKPEFTEDFYLAISGPPEANYTYDLRLDMRMENAEDECEC